MNRTKLKFRPSPNSWDVLPQKLIDLRRSWAEEEVSQQEAARFRAEERARRQALREDQVRREAYRKEREDEAYQRRVERLIEKWEEKQKRLQQKETEVKVKAERLGREVLARIRVEQERQDRIWNESVRHIEDRNHIDLDVFDNDYPIQTQLYHCQRPGKRPWTGYSASTGHREWQYRREGRGPRHNTQKQPRGWKRYLPHEWSRREFIEAKWDHLF